MCPPVMAAMAVVSTMLSIAGSVMAHQAQSAAYEANAASANKATVNAYAGLGQRQNQERDKAAVEQFDIGLKMASARSSATASAGDTGTAGGVSFDTLLRDYEARGGRALDNVAANFEMSNDALQSEKLSAQSKGEMAINSMPRPSSMALFADVGAKLAQGGMKAYSAYTAKT